MFVETIWPVNGETVPGGATIVSGEHDRHAPTVGVTRLVSLAGVSSSSGSASAAVLASGRLG